MDRYILSFSYSAMNIHIIFPENSIYMQWMSVFISLSLFFFPPDLRCRELTIFLNSRHIVIIHTGPLYCLNLFHFSPSFSISTPTQSQNSTFLSALPEYPGNYNFQNLLIVRFHFIFCQWEALIKDLEGKIDAGVINFPPSLACRDQDLDRWDFTTFYCISCELQQWFPAGTDLANRNFLLLWEVEHPSLTFSPHQLYQFLTQHFLC